jgi:ABC-2 type transport system ATP-binding protein
VPQEFNFDIFSKVIDIPLNQAGYYGVPPKLAQERVEYYLKKL